MILVIISAASQTFSTKNNILGLAPLAAKDSSGILSFYAMKGRPDIKILTGNSGGEGSSQKRRSRSVGYASNSSRTN